MEIKVGFRHSFSLMRIVDIGGIISPIFVILKKRLHVFAHHATVLLETLCLMGNRESYSSSIHYFVKVS